MPIPNPVVWTKQKINNLLDRVIIHPFLFAIFPIVFLIGHNLKSSQNFSDIASPPVILVSVIMVLGFTALLYGVFLFLIKDRHRVGVIISAVLVLFFSYGPVYNLVRDWQIGEAIVGRHRYLLSIWSIGILAVFFILKKARVDFRQYTARLTIVFSALLVFALFQIGIGIYRVEKTRESVQSHDWIDQENVPRGEIGDDGTLPDIYYIIADGHASEKVLRDIYRYDNSAFSRFLEEKGFYVAKDSQTNYPLTFYSLASSLNMDYINYLSDILGEDSKNTQLLAEMRRYNQVFHNFKSLGYKIIYASSVRINKYPGADLVLGGSGPLGDQFVFSMLEQTMLHPFLIKALARNEAERIRNTFPVIAQSVKDIAGPKFVFAHILLPHPPFLFDAEGNISTDLNSLSMFSGPGQKEAYVAQLQYTDILLRRLIDNILTASKQPPIIVLQADHGPDVTLVSDAFGTWHPNPTPEMLRERFGILNAYYFPSGGKELLYDSISPVNSFRIIFNAYFGGKYELLEDKSYFFQLDKPYKFQKISFE